MERDDESCGGDCTKLLAPYHTANKGGVPRAKAMSLHSQKPNEVAHTDYLYADGTVGTRLKYVLMMKHDVTSN